MSIKNPIDHARDACYTMIRKFAAEDLPPKGRFHYHQGVFLSGMYKTYELCKDEKLFSYIKNWIDSVISEDGIILVQDGIQMDDMQPGILLYPLMDKFDDQKYRLALAFLMGQFACYPRSKSGGLWHKDSYQNEMWLDGLYMGGPINAEYGKRFNSSRHTELVIEQIKLMRKFTMDDETGLWYHAWSESKTASWANPQTGQSPEFWGRSIGWVTVAILDDLDFISKSNPSWNELVEIVVNLIEAVCKYQDATGLWYQVVNRVGEAGNWLETSCSCLFVASICKAVRMGLMDSGMLKAARKGYDAIIGSLKYQENDVLIGSVCIGTGVGDYEHYCNRPTSTNDLHGVGAYLIMCAEAERVFNK